MLKTKISSFPTQDLNEIIFKYKRQEVRILAPSPNAVNPNVSTYTPQQIRVAYGINNITVPGNLLGSGITVAVIIAYTYPNIQADFNTYCTNFGLPLQTLNIITMSGATQNSGWALEECLDVQQVHSVAPYANIMVVEARSASFTDIFAAITYAATHGANIISMSFGSREFASELSLSASFNNTAISYVASSGDTAAIIEFPSSSPNVLSVGGTTLNLNANGTRISETTWNSGGCGVSAYITKPAFQTGISTITGNKRTSCDISLVANPSTGVYTYYNGFWYSVGGTSASAPLFSGMLAICNQLRVNAGKSMLTTVNGASNNILTYIYKQLYLPSLTGGVSYRNNFNDITVGSDGRYRSANGYDYPTGLGSPKMNILATSLLNA
jgi:subtilase family serine protease